MSNPEKLRIAYASAGRKVEEVIFEGENFETGIGFRVIGVPFPSWLDSAERCRWQIEGILRLASALDDRDLIVASSSVLSIDGSGPLIPTEFYLEEAESVFDLLCGRLIGDGEGILEGEFSSGAAIYDLRQDEGLLTETRFPIEFQAFRDRDEVMDYLRALAEVIVLESELITPKLEAQDQAFTPDLLRLLGEIAQSREFPREEQEAEEEKILRRFYLSDEKKLNAGLWITQDFPGGIYLAALVRTGKVRAIDDIPLEELSNERLGRYLLLARDANSPAVLQLIDALENEKISLETVYEHGVWKKVYLEGRRGKYPLHLFYLLERERLNRSSREIWQDELLPAKVRRQLLLQRLGVEINPHLHVPLGIFHRDGVEILVELRQAWHMPIGVSSALMNEPMTGRTPAIQFFLDMENDEIRTAIQEYQRELIDFGVELDPRDQVIFYPFVFGNPELVVGVAIRFDTRPQLAGDRSRTNWVMEIQKGRWPRGIDPAYGGYVMLAHQPAIERVPGEFEPTGSRVIRRWATPDVTDQDPLLAIAQVEAERYAQSYRVLAAIREIMAITGGRSVCLEGYFHRRIGRILAIDFHV